MKRPIAVITLFVGLLALAAFAKALPEPDVLSLQDLIQGVHLHGCQVRDHGNDPASECLSLRRAILARAQTGPIVARRHAFKDASAVCRAARNLKSCIAALDRRAAD